MQGAKANLGEAKVKLQQMELALTREHSSDTGMIKGEVTTGIGALQDSVTNAILASARNIQVLSLLALLVQKYRN